jgi:hypothetical protein
MIARIQAGRSWWSAIHTMAGLRLAGLTVVSLTMCAASASAQDTVRYGGVALGVTAGTLGLGIEGSIKATDWLVLRSNVSGYTLNKTQTVSGNSFTLSPTVLTAGLIADLHLFSNGFRLSAGGRLHDSKWSGSGATDVTLGDHRYRYADIGKLNVAVVGNKAAPYLGLGYDSAHYKEGAFSLSIDLGALYIGEPKSSLSTEKSIAGLDVDLRKEETKIDNKISGFGFYPVVQVAGKYRF